MVAWLADDGSSVTEGQEIVEIETDKARMPCLAEADVDLNPREQRPKRQRVALARRDPKHAGEKPTTPARARIPEASPAATPRRAGVSTPAGSTSRPAASPVARRIARGRDVSLDDVTGTGPRLRITKRPHYDEEQR